MINKQLDIHQHPTRKSIYIKLHNNCIRGSLTLSAQND